MDVPPAHVVVFSRENFGVLANVIMPIYSNILKTIGRTPVIKINRVSCARPSASCVSSLAVRSASSATRRFRSRLLSGCLEFFAGFFRDCGFICDVEGVGEVWMAVYL